MDGCSAFPISSAAIRGISRTSGIFLMTLSTYLVIEFTTPARWSYMLTSRKGN